MPTRGRVTLDSLGTEEHSILDRSELIETGYGTTRFKITSDILEALQAGKVVLVDCNYGEYGLAITLEEGGA